MKNKKYLEFLFLIILGALTSLSLPPYNYLFINFFTISLFFIYIFQKKRSNVINHSFLSGWLFGFGYFLSNLYWISISLTFDENFSFLIPFALILIPLFLGTFYGLATYFFLIIILLINKKKFKNEFLIFIYSVVISIFLSQIIFHISLSDDFVFRTKDQLLFTLDRINLWKYGHIIFLENPYFGKGPGGFAVAAYNDFYAQKSYGDMLIGDSFTHNHPHNFIIQFLVEWGIVGTSLILILLIILSIRSLKYFFKFKDYHLLIPGLSIVGLTFHGLVDGALFHATFTFYFVLFLSVLCSEISKKTNKNS